MLHFKIFHSKITIDNALQINLIIGEVFKLDDTFIAWMDHTLEVVKWFNSHRRPLGLFCATVQLFPSLTAFALILQVLTQWTLHYLCVLRL